MAAYDITITPAAGGTGPVRIDVDSDGGAIKLLGAKNVARFLEGGDIVYYFAILVEGGSSGNPDPITFNATQIIEGKTVKRDDTSKNRLEVVVLARDSATGNTTEKDKQTIKIKI